MDQLTTKQRMPRITVRQLWHFVAAADAGKLSEAGRRLHLAPSALSSSIEELEKALGVQLCIRRKAKGLTLTHSGEAAIVAARNLLTEMLEFESMFASSEQESLTGPLAVGAYNPLAPLFLPTIESEFSRLYPNVRLEFIEDLHEGLVKRLREGNLDLAFLYDLNLDLQLHTIPLMSMSPRVLMPADHPLAGRNADDPLPLELIADEKLILFGASPLYEHILRMFSDADLKPQVVYTSRSYGTVRAFVGRGAGLGISLENYKLIFSVENRRIATRPLTGSTVKPATVCIAMPQDVRTSSAASRWIEIAHEIVPNLM